MKIIDCVQGGDEWKAARLGRVTASRIADVVAKAKSGVSASRATYCGDLVAERLSGTAADRFVSAAMQHGTDCEPMARAVYEFMHDVEVVQVGIVLHPTIDMASASPDGLVETDGLIQIKCPLAKTHIATLLGAGIDGGYAKQMQFELACTGRAWVDFVSFCPSLPAEMQLHVTRVHRDPMMIAELEREARLFLAEVDETVSSLLAKYQPKAEAA